MFALGSTVQEKHEMSPAHGHNGDYEIGAPDTQGEVKSNGIFSLEKAQGRRQSQLLLRGIQWKEKRK